MTIYCLLLSSTVVYFDRFLLLDLDGFVPCDIIVTIAVGTVGLSFLLRAFVLLFFPAFFLRIYFGCSEPRRLFSSEES